ncbi:hypothetical protein OG883_09070 [Streptomyces sp. NBC_01142]|uniref:hypothetical protein n=1 Tax=Streptomyces sp. NBC_01142 TaxID=2975865 RepID=UPI0022543F8B|nr:hypothetical protein [Streptomyces sp. NBC_01142]MCX4820052.1 hypothetical protein [Streptomyces sp. NBC_01142]
MRALAGIPLGLLLAPLVLFPLSLLAARIIRRRSAPPRRSQRRTRAELDTPLAEFTASSACPTTTAPPTARTSLAKP